MSDGSVFQFDSYVRGYHAYTNIWEPLLGECLKCVEEPTNAVDKHAMIKIKLFSVTSVNFGFLLNVTTLII